MPPLSPEERDAISKRMEELRAQALQLDERQDEVPAIERARLARELSAEFLECYRKLNPDKPGESDFE